VVFPHSPFEGAEAGLDLSRAGVFNGLSKELKETGSYGYLLDEKGVGFDNLRGDKGASGRFYEFLNRQNLGEDTFAPVEAIKSHAASSTEINSSLARVWMGRQREWATKSLEEHLGAQKGLTELEQYAEMTKQEKTFKGMLADVLERPTYNRAMTYQHAFTYGILTRVKVGNRTKDGRIILARTESKEALKTNGFQPGETSKGKVRRRMESTSVVQVVEVFGSNVTFFALPPHRVFATYLQSPPSSDDTLFACNPENEFLAIVDDAPTYLAPKQYGYGTLISDIIKQDKKLTAKL